MKNLFPILPLVLLFGCYSVPETVVYRGLTISTVGPMEADCKDLFELTQDCSNSWGPQRKIRLENLEANIAGSEDGTVVLLMRGNKWVMDSDETRILADRAVEQVGESGIEMVDAVAIAANRDILGYYLVFDGDAYSALKALTVEDNETAV